MQGWMRATSFPFCWHQSCTDVEALPIIDNSKHLSFALCGLHGHNVLHAEHGAHYLFLPNSPPNNCSKIAMGKGNVYSNVNVQPSCQTSKFSSLTQYNREQPCHLSPLSASLSCCLWSASKRKWCMLWTTQIIHALNTYYTIYTYYIPKSNAAIKEKGKQRANYVHADRWAGL